MEPELRYCTTSDGLSIAYSAIGKGEVVLDMGQPPLSHMQLEWQIAPLRAWYERFGRHRRFVRFDTRGTGLSDRDVDAYSVETQITDTEAVASAVGGGAFTLIGQVNSAPAAIAYAALHPGQVSRLVLWCGYSRGHEFFDDSGTKALRDMIDRDWHMMTETASRSRFGWAEEAHAREIAELWRTAVSPKVMAMVMDTLAGTDVTPVLSEVRAPTLVIQREKRGADVARRIAAGIPDARLVMVEGASAAPYLGDAEAIWQTIAGFLGIPVDQPSASITSVGRLHTILFTDIVANTALLQRLGDERWRALLREHERVTRALLASHGGTEIKMTGDGFMASFGSAQRAVECAIELQRAFAAESAGSRDASERIDVRIGLNAGEPIAENDDLFGTTVTMAARIQSQADGGEILVADVVRQLVAGKGFAFTDRGDFALKGFDEPARLFAVRWRDAS